MDRILQTLFPAQIDNHFPGKRLALWVFYALTAMTLWRSQHHIFAPDGGAQSIATIPLDTYNDGGAMTVVGVFALWGLAQLAMGFVMLLACIRYKALIPLLWLFIVFEYAGRYAVLSYKPIETLSTAPGANANIIFPFVALAMLGLSLWPPRRSSVPEA